MDFYRKKGQQCDELIGKLKQSYQSRVEYAETRLIEIADDRERLATFKLQTGISDEEISHLITLANAKHDILLYTLLFNALFLSKKGLIDMASPVFKAFLQSLLPKTPQTV